jgi:hypothetical protein
MMREPVTTPPHLHTHRLADAVAELVSRDLDLLYTERRLRLRNHPDGPQRDAESAASNIAYLSSRLLRQFLDYYRSMNHHREQQLTRAMNDLEDDVPW